MRASKLLILALCLVMAPVWAEPGTGTHTIGSLDEVNSAGVYFKAAASAGEARQKAESLHDGMPSLKEIVVVETPKAIQSVAVFYTNGGGRIEASEGDTIPGGYVVKKINDAQNRVQLERGKKTFWVGFQR